MFVNDIVLIAKKFLADLFLAVHGKFSKEIFLPLVKHALRKELVE